MLSSIIYIDMIFCFYSIIAHSKREEIYDKEEYL